MSMTTIEQCSIEDLRRVRVFTVQVGDMVTPAPNWAPLGEVTAVRTEGTYTVLAVRVPGQTKTVRFRQSGGDIYSDSKRDWV